MVAMLIPKFSLRALLILMVAVGGVSLVVSMAVRGQQWAIACSLAMLGLFITFLVFGLVFLLIGVPLSLLANAITPAPTPSSPFAMQQLPPQIIPPQEPE